MVNSANIVNLYSITVGFGPSMYSYISYTQFFTFKAYLERGLIDILLIFFKKEKNPGSTEYPFSFPRMIC